MSAKTYDLNGLRVLEYAAEGPVVLDSRDISDVLGEAFSNQAQLIVIAADRLSPNFYRLQTGLLGEFFQKLANYGLRIAIVGDILPYTTSSKSLRDLVYESNKGEMAWFASV